MNQSHAHTNNVIIFLCHELKSIAHVSLIDTTERNKTSQRLFFETEQESQNFETEQQEIQESLSSTENGPFVSTVYRKPSVKRVDLDGFWISTDILDIQDFSNIGNRDAMGCNHTNFSQLQYSIRTIVVDMR